MKKLFFLFAFIPFLVNAQIPGDATNLIDLSKYHDDARMMEMVDENLKDMTDGTYTIPLMNATDITIVDDLTVGDDAAITGNATVAGTLAVSGVIGAAGGISYTDRVLEITTRVTIDSTNIAGSDVGDIGHSAGAILVAAPTSDYTLEFVSAVIFYDYSGAAFAGGGDDLVVQLGTVSQSGVVAAADLLTASGDKITMLTPLSAADLPMTVGTTLNLQGTAYTNDAGTATGSLRVHITYRRHTTGF